MAKIHYEADGPVAADTFIAALTYRVTGTPDGRCHVAVDFQRIAATLRGRTVGALVQLAGAGRFRKDLGVTLDRLSRIPPGPPAASGS